MTGNPDFKLLAEAVRDDIIAFRRELHENPELPGQEIRTSRRIAEELEKLGIEAYGVGADYRTYSGQLKRDIREVLARCKDFVTTILFPEPTYGGETIPVSGDGNITNDKLA